MARALGPAPLPALLLALLLAAPCAHASRQLLQGNSDAARGRNGPPTVEGAFADDSPDMARDEMIVRFKVGAGAAGRERALARGGANEHKLLHAEGFLPGSGDLVLAKVPGLPPQAADRAQLRAAASAIAADPDVERVEPNYKLQHTGVTNDPYYSQLWGMQGGWGTNATAAWSAGASACDGVVIGVIDEGIRWDHEDLAAHIWSNPGEVPGDGVDNDGNGYVDDVRGWDFDDGDSSTYDRREDNHGTHVSGTIGGVGNNGRGVVGVCNSGVQLISAKFLGPRGGFISGAIEAMSYLLALKRRGVNIVATSNSWGGGGFSTDLKDVIDQHAANNILFIAAAGNAASNNDVTSSYPAGYASDNIIAVGSHTSSGAMSSFSNYGATTVDIFAPGSSIISSVASSTASYASYSGTSMATPHVTGAVALYAATVFKNTRAWPTGAATRSAVLATARPNPALVGKCVTGGVLDIAALIASATSAPPPPPPPPAESTAISAISYAVRLSSSRRNSRQQFQCSFTVAIRDSVTSAGLAGAIVQLNVAISPDDGVTDAANALPYTFSSTTDAAGAVVTTTPWIPTKSATGRSSGTACTVQVMGVTPPAGYTYSTASPSVTTDTTASY